MKFQQIQEARLSNQVVIVPTDNSTEGDAVWGDEAFAPGSGSAEDQILSHYMEQWGPDISEYVEEYLEGQVNSLPSHIWIVPRSIADLIRAALNHVWTNRDGEAYAVQSFVKAMYKEAATQTVPLKWDKKMLQAFVNKVDEKYPRSG